MRNMHSQARVVTWMLILGGMLLGTHFLMQRTGNSMQEYPRLSLGPVETGQVHPTEQPPIAAYPVAEAVPPLGEVPPEPKSVRPAQSPEKTAEVIASQLPQASQEEQQIWSETLHGLPAEMVREVLQYRIQVGELVPAIEPNPPQLVNPPVGLTPAAPSQDVPCLPPVYSTPTLNSSSTPWSRIEDLRKNVLRVNFEQAETIGFKRIEAFAAPTLEGEVPGIVTRIDLTQGKLKRTSYELDLAISGAGFFCVQIGEQDFYTRGGRLSLNEERFLTHLESGGILQPPLTLPVDLLELMITPEGQVSGMTAGDTQPTQIGKIKLSRFTNPAALEWRGGGLYVANDQTGNAILGQPNSSGWGKICQKHLELSNVDLQALIREQEEREQRQEVLNRFGLPRGLPNQIVSAQASRSVAPVTQTLFHPEPMMPLSAPLP